MRARARRYRKGSNHTMRPFGLITAPREEVPGPAAEIQNALRLPLVQIELLACRHMMCSHRSLLRYYVLLAVCSPRVRRMFSKSSQFRLLWAKARTVAS